MTAETTNEECIRRYYELKQEILENCEIDSQVLEDLDKLKKLTEDCMDMPGGLT